MNAITYCLARENGDFYRELSLFTDRFCDQADQLLPPLDDFKAYVTQTRAEPLRTDPEYQLELLTMALYQHNYGDRAAKTPRRVAELCIRLLKSRSDAADPKQKHKIDAVRGNLSSTYLLGDRNDNKAASAADLSRCALDLEQLEILMHWMAATGEFKEEWKRFAVWREYLATIPEDASRSLFRGAAAAAYWFLQASAECLGAYTRNVETFRSGCREAYEGREDIVLVGRLESDYHLIMVGAEIMNRALKDQFDGTREKLVLLPGCMRPIDHRCMASGIGHELRCNACNPDCNIAKTAALGRGCFDVRVILHATDFTAILKKWQKQRDIGLVASACVLHLFTGGYEMMDLEIPSQCVFLEYCGCKRHWHKTGIATRLDENRLMEVVGKSSRRLNSANKRATDGNTVMGSGRPT